MKNRFFKLWYRICEWVYSTVLYVTYKYYAAKNTKGMTNISRDERKVVKNYWREVAGININTKEYKWYKAKKVEISPGIIPNTIYHSKIEPFFNDIHMLKGFADKNYFDLIIGKEYSPKTFIHCINGELLNENYLPLINNDCFSDFPDEIICKPSLDSCGGKGIQFIKRDQLSFEKLQALINQYKGNFVIQEIIKQHSFFSQFNPDSINTIRIISFLYDGEVHILSSFLRVGAKGNRVDNVSAGGYFIPIDSDWKLKNYAITEDCKTKDFIRHEMLFHNIPFKGKQVPNNEIIVDTIKGLHFRLAHFGIINWDVVLDDKECIKVIEYNLIDSSPSFHQINIGPIFGDLTENVLEKVFRTRRWP